LPSAYELVEGLQLPIQVSGHPALELCNTFAGWNGRPTWDYLISYDHLAVFAGHAGLLPAAGMPALRELARSGPAEASAVLTAARDLRGLIYDLLVGRPAAGAFERFTAVANRAAGSVRLVGGDRIRREVSADAGLAAPVLAAAWAASDLLLSDDCGRVRACPGTGCGWLFVDRSGRRRWCTMSTCGNRAKARRFASRHGKPPA